MTESKRSEAAWQQHSNFTDRLRTALTGSAGTPLVFVGNFEVEDRWAEGEIGLPKVGLSRGSAVVNRMDEFALLLGTESDHVVLKAAPDPDYLSYLDGLAIGLPHILVPERQNPELTVTQDALRDAGLLDALAALHGSGARLIPHGTSVHEEALAARTGLELAVPVEAVCKRVNSKVYSRRVADQLQVTRPQGWACGDVSELGAARDGVVALLDQGRSVVAKDAFGVSGKGMVRLTRPSQVDRLLGKITEAAGRVGTDRVGVVFEEWVEKLTDLNYQFTVDGDGGFHFDFVKEALTDRGVHQGHRIPARISEEQHYRIEETARQLAPVLAGDGYRGVVGVDAMIGSAGQVFPIVEINARHNMSTYQVRLQERLFSDGQVAVARQYTLRLARPMGFAEVRDRLSPLLFRGAGDRGLLVNNFATVNAGATDGSARPRPVEGRLYGLVVAGEQQELDDIDREVAQRLAAATQEVHV